MLQVNNVSYRYGRESVLDSINLTIEAGEIVCLLGESGSGKTTLLRVIAGLEAGYAGDVMLNDQNLAQIPIHQREFGLMFQDFALFPHMTVAQNVAFGLRMQNIPKSKQTKIVADMLNLVGLDEYQNRPIDALSGGQKQRVALARSLAPQPRVLMLDEPLGSLDASLRERLVVELRQIIKQIGLTAIYVTHDQQEAYAIADRIALMHQGKIEQYDTPETIYHQPNSAFVARFLGLSNIVPNIFLQKYNLSISDAPLFLLSPNTIHLASDGDLQGVVVERVFQGTYYQLTVGFDDTTQLTLYIPSNEQVPDVNDSVNLTINTDLIHPLYS